MRVIERSKFRDQDGEISLADRLQATLAHGLGWYGEMRAQEAFTDRLQRHLDDVHVLLRNVPLPGSDLIVPLILIGPQGVRTILTTDKRGVFRARGEEWLAFSSRGRRFKKTRPNMQSLAISYAQAVHAYLQRQGVPLPEVEPVIAITNPRTHIDTAQPAVRIIHADAFEHFASNLFKFQQIMDREDVDDLTELILHPPLPETEPEAERDESIDDLFDLPEAPPSDADPFRLEDSPAARMGARGRLGFSRSQWLVLGLLLLMEILVVIVGAAVIFANTLP
jgi:hypothetical protein